MSGFLAGKHKTQTMNAGSHRLHRLLITFGWMLLIVVKAALAKGPPQIVAKSQMRHVIRAGESVRLNCPVESVPPPLITWQKDGETIHLGWDRFRMNEDAHVLRIKDLEPADSGVYTCKATNGFGTTNVKYLVYVYGANDTVSLPDDFGEEIFESLPGREDPPQFVNLEQMAPVVTQHAGTTVHLTCRSSGKPKPEVTWYKNGAILQTTDENDDESERWLLQLVDIKEVDSGRYLCKVTNKAGSLNFTYNVRVTDTLPMVEDNAGLIVTQPENVSAIIGAATSFQCQIQSNTVPRVQWLKRLDSGEETHRRNNNTVILNGQSYAVLHGDVMTSLEDGTFLNKLTVSPVSVRDAGMYICSTSTSQGFSYRSAFLSILPPGPNGFSHEMETGSLLDAAFLPVIIAIIAVVGLIFVAVVIFVVCRRRTCGSKSNGSSGDAASSENPAQRLTMPVCANPHLLQQQQPEAHFDHQYAGLRSNPQGFAVTHPPQSLIGAQGRERIARGYPDAYTDYSSIAKPPAMQMAANKQLLLQQQQQQHYQMHQHLQMQHPQLQHPQMQHPQIMQHPQMQFYENC